MLPKPSPNVEALASDGFLSQPSADMFPKPSPDGEAWLRRRSLYLNWCLGGAPYLSSGHRRSPIPYSNHGVIGRSLLYLICGRRESKSLQRLRRRPTARRCRTYSSRRPRQAPQAVIDAGPAGENFRALLLQLFGSSTALEPSEVKTRRSLRNTCDGGVGSSVRNK